MDTDPGIGLEGIYGLKGGWALGLQGVVWAAQIIIMLGEATPEEENVIFKFLETVHNKKFDLEDLSLEQVPQLLTSIASAVVSKQQQWQEES